MFEIFVLFINLTKFAVLAKFFYFLFFINFSHDHEIQSLISIQKNVNKYTKILYINIQKILIPINTLKYDSFIIMNAFVRTRLLLTKKVVIKNE